MEDEIERHGICDIFFALQTAAVHNKKPQFIRSTQMFIHTKATENLCNTGLGFELTALSAVTFGEVGTYGTNTLHRPRVRPKS